MILPIRDFIFWIEFDVSCRASKNHSDCGLSEAKTILMGLNGNVSLSPALLASTWEF